MDAEARQSILAEARTWIGAPYHHKGRSRDGVDCGGLLYELFKNRVKGFRDFPSYYAEDWAMHKENINIYLEFLAPYFDEVDSPKPACIAVFRFGRAFSHGTLYTDKRTFIHAWGMTQHGGVMETARLFFRDCGKPRPVRYFDVKAHLWQ